MQSEQRQHVVDPSTALALVVAHLEQHADDDGAWEVASEALLRLDRPLEALEAARRAHRYDRPERTALLAWALAAAGQAAEARRWLATVEPDLDSAEAWERVARAHDHLDEMGRAAEAHARAVALAPDDVGRALRLAERLERSGDLAGASAVVGSVLEARPGWAPARRVRVRVHAQRGDLDEAASEARVLLEGHELADDVESGLMLELARIEARRGHPTAAMAWARQGNARALRAWQEHGGDVDALLTQLAGLDQVPPPAPDRPGVAPSAPPGHRAAFVVGFPRSGTTLVQRMLAAHSAVATFDEAPLIDRALEGVLPGRDWAGAARAADEPTIGQLVQGRWWTDALRRIGGSGGRPRLVVDKLPLNLLRLDVIVRAFPDAPIVLVLRDPRDAIISAFLQDFRLNWAMAQLTDLERAARLYDRAMATWDRVRPRNGVVLRYEDLLDDPEGTWRPVIAALGLDWEDAVLGPRDEPVVRLGTPSYAAVRAPLTRRSVGRWRAHADALEPVMPILDRWRARFGYGTGP